MDCKREMRRLREALIEVRGGKASGCVSKKSSLRGGEERREQAAKAKQAEDTGPDGGRVSGML